MRKARRGSDALVESLRETKSELRKSAPKSGILVADMRVARLLAALPGKLQLLDELKLADQPAAKLTNRTVGRVMPSSRSGSHHKYEPHMNASRHRTILAARSIAIWLREKQKSLRFDRIILSAPPQVLGELRRTLDFQLTKKITVQLNKDLTKMSEKALYNELQNHIGE